MPTIRRFAACKIAIYSDDHAPPHFHRRARFRAIVEIETLAVRVGDVRRADDAMEWARENIDLLQATWRRFNRNG